MSDKKPSLKVSPAEEKIGPEEDKIDIRTVRFPGGLADKAKSLLMKHPEIMNNARSCFRNENGKTIVEEVVPRGDLSQDNVIFPRNQEDITDQDLKAIIVFASSIVDDALLRYNKQAAYEDALHKAIWSKDGGRYAGKINASTYSVLLEDMLKGKSKKASDESSKEAAAKKLTLTDKQLKMVEKAVGKKKGIGEGAAVKHDLMKKLKSTDKTKIEEKKKSDKSAASKEATMDKVVKEAVQKQIEELKVKLASLEAAVAEKPEVKEAAEAEKPEVKEASKTEETPSTGTIVEALDEIAGTLEEQNDPELLKMAYQLDVVADVLEGKRTAATIEGDADEAYMKKYFKAGVREQEADEKYNKNFNNDPTVQIANLRKGLTKADIPYQAVTIVNQK